MKKKIRTIVDKNLLVFSEHFRKKKTCYDTIIEIRWGMGKEQDVVCPYCGKHHCNRRKDGRFCCSRCNHNFSCLVGTIFQNTKIELRKWFMAIYMLTKRGKGISSHQLSRELGVTQKTAYFMLHKVCVALSVKKEEMKQKLLCRIKERIEEIGIKTQRTENRIIATCVDAGGNVYDTSLEGQFLRMIAATYHHIDEKYLHRYIEEFLFRKAKHKNMVDRVLSGIEHVVTYADIKRG
ncbi:MAG: IS1595 family transposase [Bacteroidaceae bacterium]|nr:IS1595 family transposase [Bacteroidaceae bacterium]